jgi:hypothetical protein
MVSKQHTSMNSTSVDIQTSNSILSEVPVAAHLKTNILKHKTKLQLATKDSLDTNKSIPAVRVLAENSSQIQDR